MDWRRAPLAMLCIGFAAVALGTGITYQYDNLGRLKAVILDDGTQTHYTYDAAGNRQSGTSNAPGTLQLTAETDTVAENAGNVTISVSRIAGSLGAASVAFATANGSGIAATNYSTTSGTLSWADGDSGTKNIAVPILDDHQYGGGASKTFNISLSAASGATLGSTTVATVTITNTDSPQPGTLSLSPSAYSILEANTTVSVAVARTGGTDNSVSVQYATSNGTAVAGSQYTAVSGTLTWTNGDSAPKTFSVPIIYDGIGGTSETINLILSNPTGAAALGAASGTITLQDSEPGVLQFSPAAYSVNEPGGSVTLSVTRTNGGYGQVAVNYATANGTAAAGTKYTATSGTLSWPTGDTSAKSITVPIINNSAYEGDKNFAVSLSSPTGGATVGSTNPATVTIVDDDGPGIPANLRASPSTTVLGGNYTVLWDAASGSVNHYTLQEVREGVGTTTTSTIAAPTTSKVFAKGSISADFDYSVRACSTSDESVCSAWSSGITVSVCPTKGCL